MYLTHDFSVGSLLTAGLNDVTHHVVMVLWNQYTPR